LKTSLLRLQVVLPQKRLTKALLDFGRFCLCGSIQPAQRELTFFVIDVGVGGVGGVRGF
jgi:hypothetical protein